MKKSLIIRWVIIAIVLVVWIVAMLPIKDKDYLTTFDKLSAPTVAKLKAGSNALLAQGNPEEIDQKLRAITDTSSDEYKTLSAKLQDLRTAPTFDDWRKSRDYDELEARLTLINLKAKYEMARHLKQQMDAISDKSLPEYKELEAARNAIVSAGDYKAWIETAEYKELEKRMPAERMRQSLEQMYDKTTPEAKKLQADYDALVAKLAERPKFSTPAEERAYDLMLAHLSLVYDVEHTISGFKALEKAANGNSECYRINLNDFVKITFFGKASNKMVLRRVRTAGAGKLHLGLDLQGGTEFVLDFDIKEAQGLMVTDKVMQGFLVELIDGSDKAVKATPESLAKKVQTIAESLKGTGMSSNDIARAALKKNDIAVELRDFLTNNISLVRADDNYVNVIDIRDRILNILDNRLNSLGVTEPEIKATGDNTISVTMPSVDEADKNEIRNTIKRAARLEFYLVATNDDELVSQYEADRQNFRTPAGLLRTEIENERSDGSVIYTPVFLEAIPTPVKGEDIERAFPTTDEYGRYAISLKFNASGTIAFRDVTSKNVGRRLAIVLDGKVYSAPVLKTSIDNGQAEITGSFTLEEAKRLASVIASGNVPVTVNIGSEFGTDPTLGSDSVRSGVYAALIGLALVVLFMLYYYRFAGLVAVLALVVNTILVLGTMAIFKATITMPGIAGMILTIGMAVDANVIIFERIREELAAKANIVNAIKAGYEKAFSAIVDSNITTLLTAFFLFRFGSGAVKGFAVTLAFGIFASMFTAIFMTRAIFDVMVHNDYVKNLTMSSLFRINKQVDFLSVRKALIGISVAFCLLAVVVFAVRNSNMLGIDFSGGTQLSYECSGERPNVDKIREFLKSENYSDNIRVGYKSGQSGSPLLEIVLPSTRVNGIEQQIDYTQFSERLDKRFPEVKISLRQTNTVGANVGSQFKWGAFWAIVFSSLGIIIYLAFRFELRYGVAALIAVLHDMLVSTGLYMLCGGTLSLTVVAAILTIMGYSLNDTIVIFDRVRETRNEKKDMPYYDIVNSAINNCLSRTILTSLTTMLVVVALLVLGGGAVFDFALVMFFGIITGTYSSNFMAPAIINVWHKRTARQQRIEAKTKK